MLQHPGVVGGDGKFLNRLKNSGSNLGPFLGRWVGAGGRGRRPWNPTGKLREKLEQRRKRREGGIQESGSDGKTQVDKGTKGNETGVSVWTQAVPGRCEQECNYLSQFGENRWRNGTSGQVNMDQGTQDANWGNDCIRKWNKLGNRVRYLEKCIWMKHLRKNARVWVKELRLEWKVRRV